MESGRALPVFISWELFSVQDWNQIVRDHAATVLHAALRVLGNQADAEDVSQEVFSEAYRKWDLSPNQDWVGVLRRMAVCRAIDLLRQRKPTEILVDQGVAASSSEPVANAVSRELKQRLRVAISELPARESQVFCLMFFEQQPPHEIAKQLGISRPAVSRALSNARSKLESAFRHTWTGESK